jgi:cytochrome c oxidase assembly protein subunit 15
VIPTDNSRRLLFRFAQLTAITTLVLVSLGGLVTSKGVGMSVPDWPTSYGYNMFLFPFSQWHGGIFDEHLHRLVASGVGFLTLILAGLLQFKAPSGQLRRLGWFALGLVVSQGILGGLRVVLDRSPIAGTTLGVVFGLAHACLGQSFFVLICTITLLLSQGWRQLAATQDLKFANLASPLRWGMPAVTALIFLQLLLGASMRHQHAGLAIHDFPLAYGQVWPSLDPDSIRLYNQRRIDEDVVTAFQILLQLCHRLGAVVVVLGVAACVRRAWVVSGNLPLLRRGASFWMFLLVLQFCLGAATVLFNKPADVATAHVAVGAMTLATGFLMTLVVRKSFASVKKEVTLSPVLLESLSG